MKTIFLFNRNCYVRKNNIKKAVSIIGLATGLGIGTMMYTGCQQPTEPTGIEQEITDNYTTTLGNGNYVMHNFMFDNNAAGTSAKVDTWLAKAETYMKGLSNGFSDDFKNSTNTNYKNLLTELNDSKNYEQDTTSGFDPLINAINISCNPIFEEIISHIDTPLDRYNFICYYYALSNESYKYGYGKYFNGNKNYEEPQELKYKSNKEDIEAWWRDNHNFDKVTPAFDIIHDIENNQCLNITTHMDQLLDNNHVAEKMGISKTDLRKLINLSLNISSLTAMHDETSTTLSTHKSCVTKGNTLVDVMVDKAEAIGEIILATTKTQNDKGHEHC
ncbi:MAG: hypothetical protein J6B63_01985 [Treponema sp.]|nr:hypothetical protein [Treponema sp.]MBP3615836.1 hypothetical protein [Alphaproteobacteria bacterium]